MLRSPPRYSDPTLPPLDEADRKLVSMLLADGRASGRDLAQQTGLSEANVSRRLARLIEERSVRILGFVPPEYLDLQVQFAAFVTVKGDVDAAAAELLKHPEFTYVTAAFGAWDMVVYGVVADTRAMVTLLDRTLRASKAFHRVDVRVALEFSDAPRSTATDGGSTPPRPIDRIDRQIIRHVQEDGRISFTDIAQRTGISATSAADRFRKLLADGIVRVMTLPDPSRISLHLSGFFGIDVDRPVREVIGRLSRFPELTFFSVLSGDFPIRCEFHVRDGAHFDDLRERLLDLEGVRELSTSIHRKLYRQSFQWGNADKD
jgi:DNA-binding Lrp family transcriptional regulator